MMFGNMYLVNKNVEQGSQAPLATALNLPSDKTFSSIVTKICIYFSILDWA